MTFLLDEQNVLDYLYQRGLIGVQLNSHPDKRNAEIQSKSCKNFNLLVKVSPADGNSPPENQLLLVKQEPLSNDGTFNGDLAREWRVHELVRRVSELSDAQRLISEAIAFDPPHAILVFWYLDNYCDLEDFYTEQRVYPRAIATAFGNALATLHRKTFDRTAYQTLLAQGEDLDTVPDFCHGLNRLTPDAFGSLTAGALKFYELYQRYGDIHRAIAQLNTLYEPCCLIHNDLKLNNLLLHQRWDDIPELDQPMVRIIDWERWLWGDPALDVGAAIASYLRLWLKSLVVSRDVDITLALRLAATPLESLHPSIVAFMQAYLATFPEVLTRFPDFLERVMRFTGLAIIERILANLRYHEPFGNTGICSFQVAKILLCTPEKAIPTVFGMAAAEVLQFDDSLVQRSNGRGTSIIGGNGNRLPLPPHPPAPSPTRGEGEEEDLPDPSAKHQSSSPLASSPSGREGEEEGLVDPSAEHQNPSSLVGEGFGVTGKDLCHSTQELSQSAPCFAGQDALEDLLHTISIQPDGTVMHPRYGARCLPDGLGERLQSLPDSLQASYRRRHLRDCLYDLYFSHEQEPLGVGEHQDSERRGSLKNDRVRGVNQAFYQQLCQSNQGTGYFDGGWVVKRQSNRGEWRVAKEGLTLYVRPNKHLLPTHHTALVGDGVAVRLPPNWLEPGFYGAIGNAGMVPDGSAAIEVCFNVSAEGAIALMRHFTQQLNAIALPFSFKVLLDPEDYGRYDAAILQVERSCYGSIHPIVQQGYDRVKPHLQPGVPLFMKVLAPGVGLAEEPDTDPTDFGLHRCQLLADALWHCHQRGQESPLARWDAIRQEFAHQNLDLAYAYLNAHSSDNYPLLSHPPSH
jgi:aminoglycoside phosphotransferase (APT) family kinase protein